ncbi:5'-AMP-activated protein kinase subunit beta-1-like [Centruroides vittatus]|uniref:5'-AMP-activated protein kinase subunit beta-1-like n=1 Tax=Centruroides vittatus TaxID=120091 RepID=UPI00350F2203
MGLRSSKQKSADITGSPSDKKAKKRGKKESINGDAGTEVSNQENIEPVEKSAEVECEKKTEEDVMSRNTQAEPTNVDEDSATGSGGVTAPASPDTLQGVSEETKLKQEEELTAEKLESKQSDETPKDSDTPVQETDSNKEESKQEEPEEKASSETPEKQEQTNGIPTTFKWEKGGKEVSIIGSFSGWKDLLPLIEKEGVFVVTSNLSAGDYYYKYQVDGEWAVDQDQPTTELEDQGTVNILTVSAKE